MPKPSKEYLEKLRKRYEQRKKEDKEWEEMMGEVGAYYEAVDRSKETEKKRIGGLLRSDCELKADKVIEKAKELGKVEVELHEARLGSTIPYGKGAVPQYKVKELEDKAMKLEAEVYDLIVDVVNCEKR